MKFRKKPVVIDAERFDQDKNYKLSAEFRATICNCTSKIGEQQDWHIPTLEGPLHVTDGDWIIKGVAGEFYPCKPDIFEQTYEPVSVPVLETPPCDHIIQLGFYGAIQMTPETCHWCHPELQQKTSAPVEPVPPSDTDIQNDLAPVPAPRLECPTGHKYFDVDEPSIWRTWYGEVDVCPDCGTSLAAPPVGTQE